MPDQSVILLSEMQLQEAKRILSFIPVYIDAGDYNGAINRSYYASFHALKALEVIDGYDSKKHSGAISYFRANYIKTGKLAPELSSVIGRLQEARNACDYDMASRFSLIDAQEAFENAKLFTDAIAKYLQSLSL